MKNWSSLQQWTPTKIAYPGSEEAIVRLVRDAREQKMAVRTIGSGHSFTALCVTEEILVSLDKYQGVIAVDKENMEVSVRSGTKLFHLSQLLHQHGLALENLGDIDVQSIAGAVSTGTHGTGTAFGNLSTQVTALRFVDGNGNVVSCSVRENPELLRAARLSLGALGIITELTLRVVPSYKLSLQVEKARLDDVLEKLEEYEGGCRNFEFYWFPNTPFVMTKELRETGEAVTRNSVFTYAREMMLENYAFLAVCELGYRFPSWNRKLSAFAASTTGSSRKVDWSHRVFSTPRLVRFNEMEYSVPMEAYRSVMEALTRWVNKYNYDVLFPLENRFVRADDNYLSPAYGRNSAYVAAHVYHKKPHQDYFRELEAIFRDHDGRPHWGKLHTLDYPALHDAYPEFDRFCSLRQLHDPRGMFLSPYLRSLFQNVRQVHP
ncbi:D-arabinono-1,4-lactone oxidase [Lewinella sp. W8]|uniref:D-arabinono-1,4-lactone oxidase n=1 Tax=Lewinella sp. W8 TaxID=2528208 RepID=UPI001068CFF9|nr:D-arabinono-1,4-lactone oxidase [Lewinella sp. W8]MTB51052.1 FAD-binding protein [Lewinella sp. W8]